MNDIKLKVGGYYYTTNKSVVKILRMTNKSYGILGEIIYLTESENSLSESDIDTWDDSTYPYKHTWDGSEHSLYLTRHEVSREDYPEYFL